MKSLRMLLVKLSCSGMSKLVFFQAIITSYPHSSTKCESFYTANIFSRIPLFITSTFFREGIDKFSLYNRNIYSFRLQKTFRVFLFATHGITVVVFF